MRRFSLTTNLLILGAFLTGFFSHLLYQRWAAPTTRDLAHPVTFSPLSPPAQRESEAPLVYAREVEKIKALSGNPARVRGRVYRVGHSAKSDTYFLNFGPSRSSFTAVIFASSVELFRKGKTDPRSYEGKEVELTGEIRDHPKYGVEMILEDPAQIKVVN